VRGQTSADAPTSERRLRPVESSSRRLDGPFAETKEVLGGYYLLDVDDLDAALAWAAKAPNLSYGSVELRPVMTFG